MSGYWIEIHPENKPYIIVSDDIIKIMKLAKFPENVDVYVTKIDKEITIVFYKDGANFDKVAKLVGNKITNIVSFDISKVYKLPCRLFVTLEQKDNYEQNELDFNVFVIDFTTDIDEPTEKESESLDDVFQ